MLREDSAPVILLPGGVGMLYIAVTLLFLPATDMAEASVGGDRAGP